MWFLVVLVLLLITLVLIGVGIGISWAEYDLASDREALDHQRAGLAAEWAAIDNTRRVRAVFLGARHQMFDEATRAQRGRSDQPEGDSQ